MNILIRRTYNKTYLAIVWVSSREIREGEGHNIEEAIGRLVTSNPQLVAAIASIKYDVSHEYTRHFTAKHLLNPVIYERATSETLHSNN